ncbi:MAG: DNA-directed RNA polymerase subunit omega [Omnitrophica bacterium RIFCSPHIGHO2_02_FULL_49_9]|nr:MAG: DNA-directed RNA polymerase subunit omega [Omnitrophica bacterium RIFCSPHIGHO2_02_FULL_49_9]OGW89477.1 MAG: DNA-directed RNA polymerase subunit omega [Omnitrophica bacterium RIFCSPLOWO2_01_FULL_50_24]
MTIPIEKLLQEEPSHYRLVLLGARRANELAGGAQPLIHPVSKKSGVNALAEIAAGKVHNEVLDEKGAKNSARTKRAAKVKKS